jgi:hypothetical protein
MLGSTRGHPFARIAVLFQRLLLQGLLSFLKDPYPFARIGEDILKNSVSLESQKLQSAHIPRLQNHVKNQPQNQYKILILEASKSI